MHRTRQILPLLAWFAALLTGIALFAAMGDGALAAPPLGTPSAWGAWAAEREPIVAAVALLRLVVLALAWYLVAVTTVGLLARLTRAARLVRVADALSVPVVRHLLQSALGLTLAAGVVAASSGPLPVARAGGSGQERSVVAGAEVDGTPSAVPEATMVALDGDAARAEMARTVDGDVARAEMTRTVDGDAARAEMVRAEADAADPASAEMVWLGPPGAQSAADEGDPASAEHVVVGGDHLWGIAESTLAGSLDRAPTEAEVADYWERLIEVNRGRLVDPDNPDLIIPGQRVQLPDPGAGSVPS